MAWNSLAHDKKTLYERFVTRLGAAISNYTQICDVVTTDTPNLQVSDIYGIGAYTQQGGASPGDGGYATPTDTDVLSSKNVVSTVVLERMAKLAAVDMRDSPTLAGELVDAMADAGQWSIASAFWQGLNNLSSTNHPDTAYQTSAPAQAKFIDDFNEPVAGESNKLGLALTGSNLGVARAVLRKQKDASGKPLGLDVRNENLALIVPPSLETVALDITGRRGEVSDGSTLHSGSFFGMKVVVSPVELDATDWFLSLTGSQAPFFMWVRQAPKIRITEMPDTGAVAFYAECEAKFVLKPKHYGIVQSIQA